MIAVILMPNSITNGSDRYRVAWDVDWLAYANGAKPSYGCASFATYAEAETARDKMNEGESQ
jgi:hypothetical protein